MTEVPACRQGDVWQARLDPVVGHEQGGIRPALIVSVDQVSSGKGEMCIVVPFTRTDRGTPLHVRVDPPEGGLTSVSFALPENVRSISRERLAERLGGVRDATLEQVLHRIHLLTRKPK
ncbi:MAG TPA: type II toxin-antitoxin system PemK/MazF family toxin [Solirubrobacteraceae bacterium]|nr:type II toxin-antitoxin system PemK/MazF family toxin [Solirubrobacteraceae bacterium]